MKIITKKSHYPVHMGVMPQVPMPPAWYAQNPFQDNAGVEGLSFYLEQPAAGITDGHNTMTDSGYYDGLFIDREVPISPLFARDLAGRVIYLGYGPEVKENAEWGAYQPPVDAEGKIAPEDFNPLLPFVCFPRHCRDTEGMAGAELLEGGESAALFCKFRLLEMPTSFQVFPSGAGEDDEPLTSTYNAANLYPYKMRPDTFYPDGYRLPQTQMLFARGEAQGVNPLAAAQLGENLLQSWQEREVGTPYDKWFEAQGDEALASLFARGCTLIPTFEAFNGLAVVGRNFEMQDYWPGRAVQGLHEIITMRPDQAPRGTILQVLRPGYITATKVVQAQVIVSDGSGYVSPNAADPAPRVPNLNLPHSRQIANWRACHLPTHPLHFEAPALWGWEPETGKFLQISGPVWAPLYYYYACTDILIDAYEFPESWPENPALIPTPASLKGRFWPIVAMPGFDTFDIDARAARHTQGSRLRSILVREESPTPTVGPAYHPLPLEFEFECEPFWFPELHPLNRGHGLVPEELAERIVPVISPTITPQQFIESVKGVGLFRGTWLNDPNRMLEPSPDVLMCYPQLVRYLIPEMEIKDVTRLSPVPVLSDLGEMLKKPAVQWWADEDGTESNTVEAINIIAPGLHDALWDALEAGVELVRFRHMVYQTNLPLYMLSYWYGAAPQLMQTMMENWITTSEPESEAEGLAASPMAEADPLSELAEEELSPEEIAQLRAVQSMANARTRNRLVAEQAAGMPEEQGKRDLLKVM
jgi:hypothetical protein